MKEVRRIKFTGKNLNDVFALPCVKKIIKVGGKPVLCIDIFKMKFRSMEDVVYPGYELVEYENGLWEILHPSAISPQTSHE